VPITVLALVPNAISARIDLPANSVQQLIAYAKANPGKVTYASQGNGSTSHLSAQMLATMAGIEMVHIPYKGEGPALIDLTAGRVDIFVGNISAALRFEKAKQLKFLGVASHTRIRWRLTCRPRPRAACPILFRAPGSPWSCHPARQTPSCRRSMQT
jgi:tripartite-type tricarboxylate transporter receptor subunit TctC